MGDVFKAIADPTRREILLMLMSDSSSIGTIAGHFNMSRPAIAKHIRILEQANLLVIESDDTDARQRNCMAQLEALSEVSDFLVQLESFWNQKFSGLGSFLDKNKKSK